MASEGQRKLFLGARLKRLRRDLGVTQMRMAEDLGVSPSYLNLLERNQRPVTAQVLLKLAETYDLNLRTLTGSGDEAGATGLGEVFSDQLFRDLGIARHELTEVAENAPGVAEGVLRLYRAYLSGRGLGDLATFERPEDHLAGSGAMTPSDWVRDVIQSNRNYFADLEEAAESVVGALNTTLDFAAAARERLADVHKIEVRVMPLEVLTDALRRYDHHRKRLFLSEILGASGRAFSMAYQLALLEQGEVISAIVARSQPPDTPSANLLRVSLANYLAAAILMPYAAFHDAAERSHYDIELIRSRFGVSYEQACHRLTTLGRPSQRGVPFFMLRVDCAGNISKRYASAAFPFSRFGGTCPRWNLHSAFKTPGRIVTQVVETPDGARYFTVSRTVRRASAAYSAEDADLAVGLGCELKFASRLIYSRGLDLVAPPVVGIGPACRLCERPACPQRAAEPINRTLTVEDFTKSVSPYPFSAS